MPEAPGPNDGQLLTRYATAGDELAFAELARRHGRWVYATATRLTRDPTLAEDVTQGVFLALARHAAKLASHPNVAGWLFRAAQLGSKDALRRQRRRRQYEAIAMEQAAAPRSGPADEAWAEIRETLDQAVDALPGKYRQAIVLRFYQQLSTSELAAALGVAEEAARKRVTRAVARLRSRLGARGDEALFPAILMTHVVDEHLTIPTRLADAISRPTSLASAPPAVTVAIENGLRLMTWWAAAKVAVVALAVGLLTLAAAGQVISARKPPPAAAGGAARGQTGVAVTDVTFDPIRDGKNVVTVTVRSNATADAGVYVNVTAQSNDGRAQWKGLAGGTSIKADGRRGPYPIVSAGQSTPVRFVFQIPEPFGPQSRLVVDVQYSLGQKTISLPPRTFVVGKLDQRAVDFNALPLADAAKAEAAIAVLKELQARFRLELYGRASELFTQDWRDAETSPIRDYFQRRVDPPKSAASLWTAQDVVKFEPGPVKSDGDRLLVEVAHGNQKRFVELITEHRKLKIDWISRPQPATAVTNSATRRPNATGQEQR